MDGDYGGDEWRHLVADRRRRYLLYCLCLYATPLTLADAADQITVWETGDPATDRLADRLQIYMSLYHDHLPLLVDAGVVDYRQREDTVDWGREVVPARIEPPLEHELRDDIDDLLTAEGGTFCREGRPAE